MVLDETRPSFCDLTINHMGEIKSPTDMYFPFISIYSIRVAAHLIPGKLYRRGSGLDCKSGGFGLGWFDSITSH